MGSYENEIVVLLHSISDGFITTANAELPCYKKLHSALSVKQALALESYGAEVVEDVHL